MGGISGQIQSDNLVELLEKFVEWKQGAEAMQLWVNSATFLFKEKKGYMMVGNDGIEVAANQKYGKKPTKRFVLMLHAHS